MSVPLPSRARLRGVARRTSLVLCYHGVAKTRVAEDPFLFCVPPARLREQIDLLREVGFRFVTVSELAASGPAAGRPPAPGLVALTFDDGWQDNHANLLPILRAARAPATIYVTTGILGQPNPWTPRRTGMRMLTAAEILECQRAGVEIGAHSVTHPNLALVRLDGCRREVGGSRAALQELTQRDVATFAYPYFAYGDEALQAVREAGFASAVTGQGRGGWRAHELQRILIGGKDGPASFALKVLGAYDALFHSRAGRVLRCSSRALRGVARRTIERDG